MSTRVDDTDTIRDNGSPGFPVKNTSYSEARIDTVKATRTRGGNDDPSGYGTRDNEINYLGVLGPQAALASRAPLEAIRE